MIICDAHLLESSSNYACTIKTIPTILEIPSKEHPYDPEQDFIMQRVNMFLGGGA